MRTLLTCLALAGLPAAAGADTLSDMMPSAPPGALSCTGCHGVGEAAPLPLGQFTAEEIEAAMAAFASGEREGTIMPRIAPGFTPEEVAAIAAWITGDTQ
ncbi:c-type cytochrome [Pseudoroseicyclus tamaricis]|uniref:Cytochrome c n=1 Tax=Pseudoroseicyclus tamaricis TaxID=2705421 RepID=A0A6B2JZ86_9RHOB|nr:c-type cytochrome [Pseudoroseicyclus tamaricis]NDV00682.1 cytochrome c [Pseudoroseicyclus tamaricis]